MNVKRYEWEDALIRAESHGLLEAGAVNMCLRLASAINWDSKGAHRGKPSGLYWKNEDALNAVGSSRATYFRYRRQLFDTGFLTEEKGNLLPVVPDLSQIETTESQIETTESQIETDESQVDTPYSEDTYTEDVLTEDSLTERTAVVADAPTASLNSISDAVKTMPNEVYDSSFNYLGDTAVYVVDFDGVTKTPQSQIETDTPAVEGVLNTRVLTPGEKRAVEQATRIHRLTTEQAAEVLVFIRGTHPRLHIDEAVEQALKALGVAVGDDW